MTGSFAKTSLTVISYFLFSIVIIYGFESIFSGDFVFFGVFLDFLLDLFGVFGDFLFDDIIYIYSI